MKKLFLIIVMALLAAAVFAGGEQEGSSAGMTGAEFILANGAEPESLDPHLISGVPEHRIYEGLFEGLLAYDAETAEGVPGVAESWTVSTDGTVYTFKLRKTTWSDGVPITAQTVYDSWIRELDPATAAPYAWFPSMFIKGAAEFNAGEAGPEAVGIKVIDDYTFQMELVGPLPYVEGALPHYGFAIVPIHAIEKYGEAWTNPENFVGNGPFILESWSPQEQITAVPNPTYWDKDAVSLARVIWIASDDNNTMYNAFLNGELDWSTTIPLDQIDAAKLRDDCHINPQLATYYYSVNVTAEPFTDARVRQAFSMGFDRKELVEKVTKGGQIPTGAMVPSMTGWDAIEGNIFNPTKAKQLMADAGYPDGKGFPKFVLKYNTSEGHKKIAEYVQQEWLENLGVDCDLENVEWKTFLPMRRGGDFQIARDGWVGDYQDPNTFLDMYICGGAMNNPQWCNPAFDELINKAATMKAGPARMKVLKEAEEIFITQDQASIPVYHYSNTNMIDTDKWGGWHENVMDYHPVKDVYLK
jgi:oligopeptide transport system substrate-binding protein